MGKGSLQCAHVVPPMSSFLAAPLRQLICALKSHPDGVEESVQAANAWLAAAFDSLKRLGPVLLWSEATEEVLKQAELDLKEIQRLIAERYTPPADKAQALTQASLRYYSQLMQLQSAESQRPAVSPILSLDQLAKVALNLLAGHGDIFELQTRFPLAHADIMNLRGQWQLRKTLFPEVEWPAEIDEHLNQIEGGLGAVAQYLQSDQTRVLEDGVYLLAEGSSQYARQLLAGEAEMRAKFRFGRHDAIEVWLRLQEFPSDMGPSVIGPAWDRLFQEVEAFARLIQTSQRGGLAVAQPELMHAAGIVHRESLERLNAVGRQAMPPAEVAQLLNPVWDQMESFSRALQEAVGLLQKQFGGAPRVIELVEIMSQCAAGVMPAWVLRAEVEQRLKDQQATLAAMQEATGVPETMTPLLASHQQAYERILCYCEDSQVGHLLDGWKLLSITMPPLLAYDALLRQELARTGKSGQQVTCIRCGQIQTPGRACNACGASLPQLALDEVRYEDIAGGPQGGESVADRLADLVAGLNFGSATWEQVILEIVDQLETLEKTRARFERELLRMMGREDSLDLYCQFFMVRLGQLSQALGDLAEAAEARQLVNLKAGLDSYRQLHEELIEFQNKITEGIGKSS